MSTIWTNPEIKKAIFRRYAELPANTYKATSISLFNGDTHVMTRSIDTYTAGLTACNGTPATIYSEEWIQGSSQTITYNKVVLRGIDQNNNTVDLMSITYDTSKSVQLLKDHGYWIKLDINIANLPAYSDHCIRYPEVWIHKMLKGETIPDLKITICRAVLDNSQIVNLDIVSIEWSDPKLYVTVSWENNTGSDKNVYNVMLYNSAENPLYSLTKTNAQPIITVPNGKKAIFILVMY